MILLIDNYDSFTFNLRRYFVRLGQMVRVVRHDAAELAQELSHEYAAIVISPGPKRPADAGNCLEIVRRYSGHLPLLGVCLGHQVIYEAFGGTVGPAKRPVHGKSCDIDLLPSCMFDGLGERSSFARYHSLVGVLESLPIPLRVTAWSTEREIMAVEHVEHATYGVQFHPESVLSLDGYRVLRNFLNRAGLRTSVTALPEPDLRELSDVLANDPWAQDAVQPFVLPMPAEYR